MATDETPEPDEGFESPSWVRMGHYAWHPKLRLIAKITRMTGMTVEATALRTGVIYNHGRRQFSNDWLACEMARTAWSRLLKEPAF